MAYIELVIKIPEEIMEYIKNNGCLSVIYNDEVAKAITKGTPLPKGHGRLIDADELKKELKDNHLLTISGYRVKLDDIDDIPTIQAVPIEVLDKIRAEIEEKYGNYDICEWFEDYDYEENNISEYRSVGDVSDILAIIDKYKAESEVRNEH